MVAVLERSSGPFIKDFVYEHLFDSFKEKLDGVSLLGKECAYIYKRGHDEADFHTKALSHLGAKVNQISLEAYPQSGEAYARLAHNQLRGTKFDIIFTSMDMTRDNIDFFRHLAHRASRVRGTLIIAYPFFMKEEAELTALKIQKLIGYETVLNKEGGWGRNLLIFQYTPHSELSFTVLKPDGVGYAFAAGPVQAVALKAIFGHAPATKETDDACSSSSSSSFSPARPGVGAAAAAVFAAQGS